MPTEEEIKKASLDQPEQAKSFKVIKRLGMKAITTVALIIALATASGCLSSNINEEVEETAIVTFDPTDKTLIEQLKERARYNPDGPEKAIALYIDHGLGYKLKEDESDKEPTVYIYHNSELELSYIGDSVTDELKTYILIRDERNLFAASEISNESVEIDSEETFLKHVKKRLIEAEIAQEEKHASPNDFIFRTEEYTLEYFKEEKSAILRDANGEFLRSYNVDISRKKHFESFAEQTIAQYKAYDYMNYEEIEETRDKNYYTVLPGDTLYEIARIHGYWKDGAPDYETLCKANNIEGTIIRVGQQLILPPYLQKNDLYFFGIPAQDYREEIIIDNNRFEMVLSLDGTILVIDPETEYIVYKDHFGRGIYYNTCDIELINRERITEKVSQILLNAQGNILNPDESDLLIDASDSNTLRK